MCDTIFRKTVIAKCKAALQRAKALDNDGHAGLRGTLREILTSDLLSPVLPPEASLGTGQLVSSNGAISPQVDVVIYARGIMPPSLFDDKTGYFPIEACLYAIEVKSRLTAKNLKTAVENARSMRNMFLVSTEHWKIDSSADNGVACVSTATPHPVRALFAFDSDLKGDAMGELTRYRKIDLQSETNPAIQVICIYGRGYWYSFKNGWKYVEKSDEIDEIMSFLAGTTNTIPRLLAGKGRPSFGKYLDSPSANHQSV